MPYGGQDPRYLNGTRPNVSQDGRKTLPNRVWVDPEVREQEQAERRARLAQMKSDNAAPRLLPNRLTAHPSVSSTAQAGSSVPRGTPSPATGTVKRLNPVQQALGPEAGFARKRNEAREAASRSKALVLASKTSQAGAKARLAAETAANGSGGGQIPPDVEIESPAPSPPRRGAGAVVPRGTAGGKRPLPPLGWVALAAAIAVGASVLFSGDGARDAEVEDDEDEEAA